MSALYRLKAYFGMVPADELDDYAQHYADHEPHRGFAPAHEAPGYEPDYDRGYRAERYPDRQLDGHPVQQRRGSSRWSDDGHDVDDGEDTYDTDGYHDREPPRLRQPRRGWSADAPVRGALAVDTSREVSVRTRPAPVEDAHPFARITTLHPRTYNEARTIGEHYRDGIPVIMNLTGMEDADAKRLVDFAAGLAFALRGSIDKVTTKVFLISPPNVDVTAEDRRRIAEGRFLDQS